MASNTEKFSAGLFIFSLIIFFLWGMLFFWHVMLGIFILGSAGIILLIIHEIYQGLHYVDDHLIHHR